MPDRNCLTCDGSGFVCDLCGESQDACCCMGDLDSPRPTYSDCRDCDDEKD